MDGTPRELAIDLGSYHLPPDGEPEPEHGPPWPGLARLRRLRLWRWLPAALALLLAAPLGGAAGAVRPALEPVWSPPITGEDLYQTVLAGDRLFALVGTGSGGNLTAYRLSDGQVEWRAPLRSGVQNAFTRLAGAVPVVSEQGQTTAYDPETGRELWSHPGEPRGQLEGREQLGGWLLLEDWPASDERRLTAVAVATGETAGPLRLAGSEQVQLGWRSADGTLEVYTLRPDGRLTRYDLASGEVRASVETGYEEELRASSQNTLTVAGEVLVLLDPSPDGTIAAFDPATLAPGWTTSGGEILQCGPVICVTDGLAHGLTALDPVTGQVRWEVGCEACGALTPVPLPPARLLLSAWEMEPGTGEPQPRSWLLDAVTGERLTEPIGWRPSRPWRGPGVLAVSEPVLLERGAGTSNTDPEATPTRTWWALGGAGLTSVTVLGSVPGSMCMPQFPYLLCADEDEPATVWRINR